MARKVILQLLLLALPFVTYFLYVKLARRAEAKGARQRAPWFWLTASGLALSIAGAVWLTQLGAADPGAEYVPAQARDGGIAPGHFK